MGFLSQAVSYLGLGANTQIASPMAPSSHLESVVWQDLFGFIPDAPVTRQVAMSLPVVRRGRNLITTIARFPLIGMSGDQIAKIQPSVCTLPEPGRPRFQTLTWTLDSMLFYGRAWWIVKSRDARGLPAAFQWIPEWEADVLDGQLVSVGGVKISPRDVVRIDSPHDGILNDSTKAIRTAIILDAAAAKAAENPVPTLELHQTAGTRMTNDEIKEMLTSWLEARKKFGVAYTSENLTAIPHGIAPEQLLIEGRKASDLALARLMGLPAWAIDAPIAGSSLTYSNTPSRSRELLDYTLAPYITAIEERLSMDDVLPSGEWCRFDTRDLLRDDFRTRMDSYKLALETGVYTLDELRSLERGNSLESRK